MRYGMRYGMVYGMVGDVPERRVGRSKIRVQHDTTRTVLLYCSYVPVHF